MGVKLEATEKGVAGSEMEKQWDRVFQSPGDEMTARGTATIEMGLSPPISQCQGTGY